MAMLSGVYDFVHPPPWARPASPDAYGVTTKPLGISYMKATNATALQRKSRPSGHYQGYGDRVGLLTPERISEVCRTGEVFTPRAFYVSQPVARQESMRVAIVLKVDRRALSLVPRGNELDEIADGG